MQTAIIASTYRRLILSGCLSFCLLATSRKTRDRIFMKSSTRDESVDEEELIKA